MTVTTRTCEGCGGSGIRDYAAPSCRVPLRHGWHVVERCDTCGLYASDLQAAKDHYDHVRTVYCRSGAEHVIARHED